MYQEHHYKNPTREHRKGSNEVYWVSSKFVCPCQIRARAPIPQASFFLEPLGDPGS